MRVLTVVLALVAIPFVTGVSQAPMQDPKNCGAHLTPADKANPRAVLAHDGRHGVMDRPCGSTDAPPIPPAPEPEPVPSACQVSQPAPTGFRSISGTVLRGESPWDGLPGWCVHLTGAVTATAMTDASGNYSFTGLPDGTYSVCEVLQSGWLQTFPTAFNSGTACPGGTYGWTFTVAGFNAPLNNFRNIVAP